MMLPAGVLAELRDRLRRAELIEETCAEEGISYTKPVRWLKATLQEAERVTSLPDASEQEVGNVIKALEHARELGWGAP